MSAAGGEADDLTPEDTGYKAPAQASVGEMNALDADDEALVKWKAQLLGAGGGAAVDGPKVQVIKMDLLSEGKTLTLDLTGDVAALKDHKMQVKEGVEYKIQITFKINNEVVAGLKYLAAVKRKGITVAKQEHMLGSFGPKAEEQMAKTPIEDTPSGMLGRGTYKIKSKFIDDDKEVHLAWEWQLVVAKDW